MIWLLSFVVLCLIFYVASLKQKIIVIEQRRSGNASFRFNINALEAVMKHPKFAHFVKIKGAMEGKAFKDWSKEDIAKWHKVAKPIIDSSWLSIRYLPTEDLYFLATANSNPWLIDREKGPIYNTVVLGDKDGIEERIELQFFSRFREGIEYIAVCLEYNKEMLGKGDFTVLCELPVNPFQDDNVLKQLGFKVKRDGGDDFFEDSFGEHQTIATFVDIEKNGVKFSAVY